MVDKNKWELFIFSESLLCLKIFLAYKEEHM